MKLPARFWLGSGRFGVEYPAICRFARLIAILDLRSVTVYI